MNANAGFVLTVTFTRDGSMVVTGGTDGTVRLWDADTMKQIGANLPHADNEATVAMAVNADQLLVVSAVGKLHGGDLNASWWADQACLVANRMLTRSEWRGRSSPVFRTTQHAQPDQPGTFENHPNCRDGRCVRCYGP